MPPQLSREFVTEALSRSILDPRCRALYDLCFIQRDHLRDEVVSDKLRLMLRLYAEQGLLPEGLSLEAATHVLRRSCVDCWFSAVATAECLDTPLVLTLHKRLMDLFTGLPAEASRGLASRYLHFHFPELFFLYDTRVEAAALALTRGECGFLALDEYDPAYGRFFACCLKLADRLAPLVGRRPSPRELDRVLRAWAGQREVWPGMATAPALEPGMMGAPGS